MATERSGVAGFERFRGMVLGVVDGVWREHPELGRYCAMDLEDLRQEVFLRVWRSTVKHMQRQVVSQESGKVVRDVKRRKRYSQRVEPLSERVAEGLAEGGRWAVVDLAGARECLRRLEHPETGRRLTREQVRAALAAIREV